MTEWNNVTSLNLSWRARKRPFLRWTEKWNLPSLSTEKWNVPSYFLAKKRPPPNACVCVKDWHRAPIFERVFVLLKRSAVKFWPKCNWTLHKLDSLIGLQWNWTFPLGYRITKSINEICIRVSIGHTPTQKKFDPVQTAQIGSRFVNMWFLSFLRQNHRKTTGPARGRFLRLVAELWEFESSRIGTERV